MGAGLLYAMQGYMRHEQHKRPESRDTSHSRPSHYSIALDAYSTVLFSGWVRCCTDQWLNRTGYFW